MDSSDDEGVVRPKAVSGYYFEDAESRPISFAELPVQWSEEARPDCDFKKIYLRGDTDNGLQKVHIKVAAWKCDISSAELEISVLSKDNNWIKLEKPGKSYEDEIRTILITLHCLHFSKRNPVASAKTLWDQLSRVFRPSENDLIDHIDFISEAVKRDEVLAKSKFLAAFLKGKSRERKPVTQDAGMLTRPGFIVDDVIKEHEEDDLPNNDAEDEESEDESDLFYSVCAFCDDGGDLTCCDRKCQRSFHAKNEKACLCQAQGISAEKVKETKSYVCRNCELDMHQCYVCGELVSSNKSKCAEIVDILHHYVQEGDTVRHGVAYDHPVSGPEAYVRHPLPRDGSGVDMSGFARGDHCTFSLILRGHRYTFCLILFVGIMLMLEIPSLFGIDFP